MGNPPRLWNPGAILNRDRPIGKIARTETFFALAFGPVLSGTAKGRGDMAQVDPRFGHDLATLPRRGPRQKAPTPMDLSQQA